jgi:hypothetical protein
MIERCEFEEDRDVTFWNPEEECEYCYQGRCVEPDSTCSDNPMARGCRNVTASWGCTPEGEFIEGECMKTPLGESTYCEITTCTPLADPPQHDY